MCSGGVHAENGKPGMPSSSTAGTDSAPEVKQWTDAELISLAEHMQQEIEIRDRQASSAGDAFSPVLSLIQCFALKLADYCSIVTMSVCVYICILPGMLALAIAEQSSVWAALSCQQ